MKIVLIGFFKETIELCGMLGYEIQGVVSLGTLKEDISVSYWENDEDFIKEKEKYIKTKLVIVPDDPFVRKRLFLRYAQEGFQFESIISSMCRISPSAIIGEGCYVQNGCNISSDVVLGNGVRLNTNANVMHDCYIGNYTTIAPNAVVLGKCRIGECSYIGANATILPNIMVGDNAMIGAGSVVTSDVENNVVVIGNPARNLKKGGD